MVKAKRITVLIAMLSVLLFVGGCGKAADVNAPPETTNASEEAPQKSSEPPEKAPEQAEAPEAADESAEGDVNAPSNERIGFITQEYDGDNIVEIPYIEYEGEMNPEIESINRLLNQGLQFSYEEFLENKSEHECIEIKSYPFTTDNYLQVVITNFVYPNYGTDGDIESINYDRNAKKWLNIEDALEMMGLSEEDVMAGVGESFDPEINGGTIDSIDIDGFLIHDAPGGGQIELLLNITVHNPETDDDWEGFYSYMPDDNPNTDDLTRLNNFCLFDPYSMDQMEPPLFYQKIPDYSEEPIAMPEWEGIYENEWYVLEISDFSGEEFLFAFKYPDDGEVNEQGVATLEPGDDFTAKYETGVFTLSEDYGLINVSDDPDSNGHLMHLTGDYYKRGN